MRFRPRRVLMVTACVCTLLITLWQPQIIPMYDNVSFLFRREFQEFQAIVILTSMRSGSSYTGDLLQQHEDSFYVYEPLRALENIYHGMGAIQFLHGSKRRFNHYNVTEVQHQAIVGWLTCDFSKVYDASFSDIFLTYSKKTRFLHGCFDESSRYSGLVRIIDTERRQLCMDLLKELCMTSKYRIIKTVRVSMTMIAELSKEIENLKVVNLIRDPRATLASFKKLGACKNMNSCSDRVCGSLWEVVNRKEELARQYPGYFYRNFYTVRYEDLLERTMKTTWGMYKFLGIPFTPAIQAYVFNMTLGGNSSECTVCKVKWQMGNQSASEVDHFTGWRQTLSALEIKSIERKCENVLKYYNYTTDMKRKPVSNYFNDL